MTGKIIFYLSPMGDSVFLKIYDKTLREIDSTDTLDPILENFRTCKTQQAVLGLLNEIKKNEECLKKIEFFHRNVNYKGHDKTVRGNGIIVRLGGNHSCKIDRMISFIQEINKNQYCILY